MREYKILFIGADSAFSDWVLSCVWEKIIADNLVSTVFYDGSCSTQEEFLASMKDKSNIPFIVFRKDDASIPMFLWLNGVEGRAMRAHFTLFRDSWGARRHATDMAHHVITWLLTRKDERGHLWDTIYGMTPMRNRLACRFILRAGMRVVGVLPNAASIANGSVDDILITYATRTTFGLQDDSIVEGIWRA